jgi:hypothetical protein
MGNVVLIRSIQQAANRRASTLTTSGKQKIAAPGTPDSGDLISKRQKILSVF